MVARSGERALAESAARRILMVIPAVAGDATTALRQLWRIESIILDAIRDGRAGGGGAAIGGDEMEDGTCSNRS